MSLLITMLSFFFRESTNMTTILFQGLEASQLSFVLRLLAGGAPFAQFALTARQADSLAFLAYASL
jgi:hypothetical protein